MQIEKRQVLTRQIWGHQRIIDEKQGGSKEMGHQLKGDLSHMYRFLSRLIIHDIHPQRNLHIWNGRWRRDHGIQKGSHEYTKRLLLKSIAHSSNLSHCI